MRAASSAIPSGEAAPAAQSHTGLGLDLSHAGAQTKKTGRPPGAPSSFTWEVWLVCYGPEGQMRIPFIGRPGASLSDA